jgi:hypothetical protein
MVENIAAVAASKSSLDTMLDTIENATQVLQKIQPEAEAVAAFVPGATVYIQLAGMGLPYLQNAIKWIQKEEGKTPVEAFEDVIRTLMPNNGFVAPSLAKPPSAA